MAFRRRNKSYPFFSQEFLIQNHADIVFSLVIFILIGLMFEVRFPFLPLVSLCLSAVFGDGEARAARLQMWLEIKKKNKKSPPGRKPPVLQTCFACFLSFSYFLSNTLRSYADVMAARCSFFFYKFFFFFRTMNVLLDSVNVKLTNATWAQVKNLRPNTGRATC